MKTSLLVPFVVSAALLAGCSSLSPGASTGRSVMEQAIGASDKVAMLPVANFTDVPQAGLRVEALLEPALRQAGLRQLAMYPSALNPETLFEPAERKVAEDARQWAVQQGLRYGVTGNVTEWRYKVGVDGEPAVGLTLQIIDLPSGRVVWSGSGGKTGYSRESLAGTAQQLVNTLLAGAGLQ